MEVLAELSGRSELVTRDDCSNMRTSIQNSINDFEIGKGLFDAAASALASYVTFSAAIEAAGYVSATAFAIEFLAPFAMVYLATIAFCDAFDNCSFLPPSLVGAANAVNGKLDAPAGVAVLAGWIEQALANGQKLEKVMAPLTAGAGLLFLGLYGAQVATDIILTNAEKYYEAALKCCGSDCSSAVCQQAARGCLMTHASFFLGTEGNGLNCAAQ